MVSVENGPRKDETFPARSNIAANFGFQGEENEHLDNLVRRSVDRVDWRFHGFSCSRRTDPPVAGVRGDLADSALCDGKKRSLTNESFRG